MDKIGSELKIYHKYFEINDAFMNTKRNENTSNHRFIIAITLVGKAPQKSATGQNASEAPQKSATGQNACEAFYTGGESNPRPTGCKPVVITN